MLFKQNFPTDEKDKKTKNCSEEEKTEKENIFEPNFELVLIKEEQIE